jgi:hypothetical protein
LTDSHNNRYPHRNELLQRVSTTEEIKWLKGKNLPSWTKSTRQIVNHSNTTSLSPSPSPAQPSKATNIPSKLPWQSESRYRILVLHGNRTNPLKFKKRTRLTLMEAFGSTAELHYLIAPHRYQSTEKEDNRGNDAASNPQNEPTRCWWTTKITPEGIEYSGLEQSIQWIESTFQHHGPFDG